MMKKLLVLALVMSVASVASAGLSLVANGSSFDLVSDVEGNGAFKIIVDAPYGDINYTALVSGQQVSSTNYSAAFGGPFDPSMLGITGLPTTSAYIWDVSIADGTNKFGAGSWARVDSLAGTEWAAGEGAVWLYDVAAGEVVATLSVVPEPATLALLGLGALVLRRRK